MASLNRYLVSYVLLLLLVRLSNGRLRVLAVRIDVRITNGFDDVSSNINVHCKSKDRDLGPHVFGSEEFFEFNFEPNFFATSLFFYRFWWENEFRWLIYTIRKEMGANVPIIAGGGLDQMILAFSIKKLGYMIIVENGIKTFYQ